MSTPVSSKSSQSLHQITQSITSMDLLSNLNSSINNYQQNLTAFSNHIQYAISHNHQIKCKCKNMLANSFSQFKLTFTEFANEWKVELPTVLRQFCSIVQKICSLYDTQINKLKEDNSKLQFSYQQLLKATNGSNGRLAVSDMMSLVNRQQQEMKNEKQRKYGILSDEYIMKDENEFMNQDITELFAESAQNSVGIDMMEQFRRKTSEGDEKYCLMQNKFLQKFNRTQDTKSLLHTRSGSKCGDSFWNNLKASASLKNTKRQSCKKSGIRNIKQRLSASKNVGEDSFCQSKSNRINELRKNLYKQQKANPDTRY